MSVEKEISTQYREFQYLSAQDITKLNDVCLVRHYKKGQVLFYPGDERNHVFFLKSGVIRLEKIDNTDSFSCLDFVKPKTIIPKIGLFSDAKYFLSCVAYSDIDIVLIPTKTYEEIIGKNSSQLIQLVNDQSEIMKLQIIKVQKSNMSNSYYRVVTTLAIIFKNLGEVQYPIKIVTVPYPITISDIAKSSGTTRETASGVIKQLIKEKKIKYNRKYFSFLDIDFFKKILTD
ncbi:MULTISPECIES: Crp/Fnr family transcriptional regulator [Enterococcaceae]|uniref:Crp/Fnr family transcriptional regulator n=1 Tax=Enterococcaceae TaxID=81852 RepID=UPI000E478656|nr:MULTISPECIES: Crp/Fnr family transcriptional regulator [Enterococcaceae]MCI0131013.1 Crp/Fnr family transcriptional regulator [Vagococcus sp. CY53-2]RGI29362.1 Crp/Fnr family transcriptional regulator [Melissococcus sp. OM08-11BH]UNM89413.1 Crp/Fnr family transcriptional regulator [Vagococcus sp. CY52-2]